MKQLFIFFRKLPGWVFTLLVVGFLYLTGLHTEAIGQVQRLILFTGLMQPDLPENKAAISSETTSLPVSEIAGNGFLMKTTAGKTVSFESLKGKVIFLNVWATWCPPCVAEMPSIQNLYNKVKSDKIAFVMLSVDEAGIEKVKQFITKKGYTFPVYLPASTLPREFNSPSIPATYIISRSGKIVTQHEGMADYDTKEMVDFLNDLTK